MQAQAKEMTDREFAFSDQDFAYLTQLVYERTGIVLGDHKKNMVYARLARRLRALGLRTFKDYCALIADSSSDEVGFTINSITTNLTKFFRESHHFDHLRDVVLADAVRRSMQGGAKRLRIWSAGCSSGEEPYTIAMTVRNAVPNLDAWDARILATDLDTNMVATGRAGVYRDDFKAALPDGFYAKFCLRADDGSGKVRMADNLRSLIAFKQLNLLGRWPMKGPFDAIFCRNVMIYFDAATKAQLVNRYADLLRPDGFLYVGHSESLREDGHRYRLEGRTVYRRVS